MGRNEEQIGKVIPCRLGMVLERFKSVLKAQKGMNPELQPEVKWGGLLTWDVSFPEK